MLTVEQINQLAPDAASLKAGREQGRPAKWQGAGKQADLLWGRIQGSGKDPYQTVVDIGAPAYNCSCPSRKFPCKHSLGLMFVAAESTVAEAAPPEWVLEWSQKRAASTERKVARGQAAPVAATPESAAEKEAAAAKRADRREKLMGEGLAQTQTWLEDVLRQGLAWAQAQPNKFWMDQVARLTNSQLPGAARMVEDCVAAAGSGEGWPARLLSEMSRLHLLCRSWSCVERLDPARIADLRATLGQPIAQESVLAETGVNGTWQVLARVLEERDVLKTYRHWLQCHETGRFALVLAHAAGSQPLDASLPPGLVFDGELVFFPGLVPLRALIKRRVSSNTSSRLPAGTTSLQDAVSLGTAQWAAHPWMPQQPILFTATPRPDVGGFVDDAGSVLKWWRGFADAWSLVALSGGHPLHLFGELNAGGFMPLLASSPSTLATWVQRFEPR